MNVGLMAALAAATLSATSVRALGQANVDEPVFRVSVVDLEGSAQRIRVPLYGSVSVETSVGIARADVIAPSIADVQVLSPTRLLVSGQGYGNTNILLQSVSGAQHLLAVSVELDLSPLNEAIRRLDPLASVEARSVLGNIVLTGTASGPERVVRIVELAGLFLPATAADGKSATVQNHLEVAGEQQVLLRCIVAEVSRSVGRELGINGFIAVDDTVSDADCLAPGYVSKSLLDRLLYASSGFPQNFQSANHRILLFLVSEKSRFFNTLYVAERQLRRVDHIGDGTAAMRHG
ncbi:MAG: pilus assembly protein N-terminal domain-containing protein [Planctomycetes bacterium]|nr:pilus assembly protein N-terminal domain-containing protein [Planctomycetota bacterium]